MEHVHNIMIKSDSESVMDEEGSRKRHSPNFSQNDLVDGKKPRFDDSNGVDELHGRINKNFSKPEGSEINNNKVSSSNHVNNNSVVNMLQSGSISNQIPNKDETTTSISHDSVNSLVVKKMETTTIIETNNDVKSEFIETNDTLRNLNPLKETINTQQQQTPQSTNLSVQVPVNNNSNENRQNTGSVTKTIPGSNDLPHIAIINNKASLQSGEDIYANAKPLPGTNNIQTLANTTENNKQTQSITVPTVEESVGAVVLIPKVDLQSNSNVHVNKHKKPFSAIHDLLPTLDPLPAFMLKPLHPLSPTELEQLENVLEFSNTPATSKDNESGWRNDWCGNLAYIDKEILNPLFRVKSIRSKLKPGGGNVGRGRKPHDKMTILQWAQLTEENGATVAKANAIRRVIKSLLRHVCTYKMDTDTQNYSFEKQPLSENGQAQPKQQTYKVPEALKILFSTIEVEISPLSEIEDTIRRASYDPQILNEDGWTTEKSDIEVGATGGAFRIGDKIRYEGSDAVVIAYIHDNDIGDLWKAIWTEDFIAFDLEAEELLQATKKWEKMSKKPDKPVQVARTTATVPTARKKQTNRETSTYGSGAPDFTVKGIEYGIVLAASYAKGARPGVFWPARVMHASETPTYMKRSSSKSQRKLDVVFLAPYWNSNEDAVIGPNKSRPITSLSENQGSSFDQYPLFQLEVIDASDEMVQCFPYCESDDRHYLDVSQLRMSFRFTGLPKSVFPRFLDAYRLAFALKEYGKSEMGIKPTEISPAALRATAALFEAHPLSIQVPTFPPVILQLPFSYILSQIGRAQEGVSNSDFEMKEKIENRENVMHLSSILNAMKPPHLWGNKPGTENGMKDASNGLTEKKLATSSESGNITASGRWIEMSDEKQFSEQTNDLRCLFTEFPVLNKTFDSYHASPALAGVVGSLQALFLQLNDKEQDLGKNIDTKTSKQEQLKTAIDSWAVIKRLGDDALARLFDKENIQRTRILSDWRLVMEKIYRYILVLSLKQRKVGTDEPEKISTVILTDTFCNDHRTSDTCPERRVRIPAALKGAKLAGATPDGPVRLICSVPTRYLDYVENNLIKKAHSSSYLKRMKSRCESAVSPEDILILTDDSDGNGGDDTRGSKGSWKASLHAVAAAVSACDMVARGDCVNAFCVTRPPGHHAGRKLHPMKAVSNGFCILNPAACAAIHATTSVVEGGLGLSRVCVIDFDVHHGNGTQDVLCSTYDPRFLYVSLHAGGAHINGPPACDEPGDEPYGLAKNPKLTGIYPGKCGDTSPHIGVLNIPLGCRVMPHAVGSALLQLVTPTVDKFAPDLIILSAGFDAHKNDPMGLGGLSAKDFGNITEVACQLALKSCSGRVLSILEGGYGVPCCRPQWNTFLPPPPISAPLAPKSTDLVIDSGSSEKSKGVDMLIPSPKDPSSLEPILKNHDIIEVATSALLCTPSEDSTVTKNITYNTSIGQDVSKDIQLENPLRNPMGVMNNSNTNGKVSPQPSRLLDLGDDLPSDMEDQVPYPLQIRLEKCHVEGFVECVMEHVKSLARCTTRG